VATSTTISGRRSRHSEPHARNTPPTQVSNYVRELLSDAAGDGDALIAFPGARYELPLHVTEILSALPKFSWSVSGFRFRFDFGGLKGSAAFECGTDAFCLFEKWVASCNPTGEDGSWKVVHELRREP